MIEADFNTQFYSDMQALLKIKQRLPYENWTEDERGINNSKIICGNCIGACCMFFTVDHLSPTNMQYLLSRGSVPIDLITQDYQTINPFLLNRLAFYHALKIGGSNMSFTPLKYDKSEIKFATTCACQTSSGLCDIHNNKTHKPRVCENGYQVGLKCSPVFIAVGSKAATEVQEIFNKAELWISLISQSVLGIKVKPRRFNFV